MKKIVLSGFFGYDNAGDEAILLSVIQMLKENQCEPIVLSANPEKTASLYKVQAVHRMKPKEVFRAIRHSDGLISGGGSLLQDVTSSRNSLYYLGVMQIAYLLKKPVFVYAQGIGPLSRKWLQKLSARQLKKAAYVSVRDVASKQFLQKIGVKRQIDLTVDPVLGLKTKNVPLKAEWQSLLDRGAIVFSLRPWEKDEAIVRYYRQLIEELNKKGVPVLLLPFHQPEDTSFSEKVAEGFDESQAFVVKEPLSLDEHFSIIQQTRFVFGVRLHSLIFAASVETPFIGLSYDPKIDAFLSLYGRKPVASISSYDAMETLSEMVHLMADCQTEKEHIQRINHQLTQQLSLPIEALYNHLIPCMTPDACVKDHTTE